MVYMILVSNEKICYNIIMSSFNPIVVSLATYSGRLPRLEKTLPYILNQTLPYDILLINVQDDISDEEFLKFESLSKHDSRIIVKKRPAKWRSFNKFIHAYKEYKDHTIITVDDDICYPKHMISTLFDTHIRHPNTIIAHELNPIDIDRSSGKIINRMAADIKLRQKCFNKYLTGCCLFPPNIFNDCIEELSDFDEFMKITNATHDELWLWIHSTIKGIPVIGLDYTWTFDLDGAIPPDEKSLCMINGNPINVAEYDKRINESKYGKKLYDVVNETPVVFTVSNTNLLAITGNMAAINRIYQNFKIVFDCKTYGLHFLPSMLNYLVRSVNSYRWSRNVTFETVTNGTFGNGLN